MLLRGYDFTRSSPVPRGCRIVFFHGLRQTLSVVQHAGHVKSIRALSTGLELRACAHHIRLLEVGRVRLVVHVGNAVIKSIILLQNFRQKQDQAFRGFISLRQSLTERQVGAGIEFSPNHHYIQGHSPKPSNRRLAPDCAPNRGEKAQRYPNIMNLPILL
jgi:hypothetical protein